MRTVSLALCVLAALVVPFAAAATAPAVPAAPTNLRLTGKAEGLAWIDNSNDETEFTVTATDNISRVVRTFSAPANATSFELPADARASCADLRPSMSYAVSAVNAAGASESASTSIRSSCLGDGAQGIADATSQPVATQTPDNPGPVVSASFSLSGVALEDLDSDGKSSSADLSVTTLVQLVPDKGVETSLFTGPKGFSFVDITPGSYVLWFWWSPGFVNVVSIDAEHPGLYKVRVDVLANGNVLSNLPATLLLRAKVPPSLIPYPVSTGGEAFPVGVASLGASPRQLKLPGTGSRTDRGNWIQFMLLATGLVACIALAGGTALAARGRVS